MLNLLISEDDPCAQVLNLKLISEKLGSDSLALPTSFARIMELNCAFKTRPDNGHVASDLSVKVQKNKLNRILEDSNATFVLAVLGIKGNKLHVDLVGSNKRGDNISEIFNDKEEIIKNHKDLKRKLKDSIPFELADFPTIIKMERYGLERVRDATDCQFYLFYFGIENGWKEDRVEVNEQHLTISVLGSERGSDRVNRRHIDLGSSLVDGEETWPRRNFTMFKTQSTGIIIPETEP